MFDRPSKEKTPAKNSELKDLEVYTSSTDSETSLANSELKIQSQENQPEVVNTVEKISAILSPYFIVIVGLYLYSENFLFGTILIFVGILSLLKYSGQTFQNLWEKIKNFFGLNEETPN